MKFKIIGRRYDVTDKIRDYVEKKLGKLDKFFKDESEARVVIGTIKDNDYIEAQATDGTWSTTWKPAVIRTVDRLGKPVLHGDPWGAVYPFFICIFIFLRRIA